MENVTLKMSSFCKCSPPKEPSFVFMNAFCKGYNVDKLSKLLLLYLAKNAILNIPR